jgi:hypothetical protein
MASVGRRGVCGFSYGDEGMNAEQEIQYALTGYSPQNRGIQYKIKRRRWEEPTPSPTPTPSPSPTRTLLSPRPISMDINKGLMLTNNQESMLETRASRT